MCLKGVKFLAILCTYPHVNCLSTNPFIYLFFLNGLKIVKRGDTIFLGQYLFTGSETTSVWLEVNVKTHCNTKFLLLQNKFLVLSISLLHLQVLETRGEDVICLVKNSATLIGFMFTVHVAHVHVELPTLTDYDKRVMLYYICNLVHQLS